MVRLFLKLYGVLIATLAVSFAIQIQLMDYVWKHSARAFDFRVRFQPTFHLIEEALAPLPQDRWAARLAELSRGFGTPVRLEPLVEAEGTTQGVAPGSPDLPQGRIAHREREGGGFTLTKRVRDSTLALAIDFPGPDTRRLRLLTYAINGAVELAIMAALVFFWVRPFWRDLRRLHAAAEQFGAGRFGAVAQVGRFSPLKQFAAAFRAMAERIAALLQSHRMLTSAVSHELRTPMARLRFSHMLAREAQTADDKDRYLARMDADLAEIDALTTELLDYAKLERTEPAIQPCIVPAAPWLEDVLADVRSGPDMAAAGLQVTVSSDLEAVRCEPRYMARALVNLVRNAGFHARSRIAVTVGRDAGRTVIHVDDDGDGIPPHERSRLFEPFARLDGSRSRDSGGFGLGLAIVRQVARWHGGDASIGESPMGGARVSIVW